MLTKSIRLTDEEAHDLEELVQATGEVEASILKRAALRGLREERRDRAVLLFMDGASSSEAATFARMPRAGFIAHLADRGVAVLDGATTVPEGLETLAGLLGDDELAQVARSIGTRRTQQ
jgi:hypothetical protein